jgi:hypothetical protein
MKKILLIVALLVLLIGVVSAASISVSLNSLEAIAEGESVTLTATVSAVGDSVSNVSLQLGALPTGTTTSDSLIQSVGTLSSGQSSSKSWTIRGDVAGNYTFNVTATGTSVSDVFQNASLVVNTAAFIEVSDKTCSATTANVGDTITMNFIVKNIGGSSSTVTINLSGYSSKFTLSSGSASSSFALSAGSQSSKSYVFTATTAGSATITAAINSTANDPTDQTCSVTVSGSDNNTSGTSVTGNSLCLNKNCGDNNPCTTDSCLNGVCSNTKLADGTSCGTNKECSAGTCIDIQTDASAGQASTDLNADSNKSPITQAHKDSNIGAVEASPNLTIPLTVIVIIVVLFVAVFLFNRFGGTLGKK